MGSHAADPPERGPLDHRSFTRDILAPSERERLVEAMAASCAERGYAQASVEEVVERAGVPPGTFERYFADKAACGLAAARQMLPEIAAVASTATPRDPSEGDSILRAVRALLELLAAQPSLACVAVVETRQSMPPEAYELYVSGVRVVAAMVDRLQAFATADRPTPPSAARGALGGAELIVRRELLAGRAWRLPELFPDIIYGALVPFLDQQEALHYAGLARELLNEGG
jgi:AcrR family transcriptional regulator